jgi:hypothetical protein
MVTNSRDEASGFRVSSFQRVLEERLANPLLRVLLRSPLHPLASRWLVLVSYEGRRTGRRYTFPAMYDRRDDSVVVVTPVRESTWWKNFVEPRRCAVWLRGTERSVVGELVTGDERRSLLGDYLETHGIVGRLLGLPEAGNRSAERDDRRTDDLAVVRFVLVE